MLRAYQPCLPTRALKAPSGPSWIHEIKHDGYRLIVRRTGKTVRLFTKNGVDWSKRYPLISYAVANLPVKSITLDGEAMCFHPDGGDDFDGLHNQAHDKTVSYCAFDLLELDGKDWRDRPLVERKARLAKLLKRPRAGIRFVEHLEGDGPTIFEHACRLGLEGIVSKRSDKPYQAGRSKAWLKVKNRAHPALMRVAEAHEKAR